MEVKPSDIAGRGLFARAPIRKNEIVGDYGGGKIRALAQIPRGREVLVGYGGGYRL